MVHVTSHRVQTFAYDFSKAYEPPEDPEGECEWCGALALNEINGVWYCAPICALAIARWISAPEPLRLNTCEIPKNHPSRQPPPRSYRPGYRGQCPNCQRDVVGFTFCSSECRCRHYGRIGSQQRRARLLNAPEVDPLDLMVVAQRDGWRCHLCGDYVKPITSHDDPLSATLDHLIPLSKGGSHTMVNVALAHRLCNIRRGAGRLPAQLRLIG